MLYMQHFMSKISAKNIFVIIKTCSASGSLPPDPRLGGCAPNPLPGPRPWTPLGDFRRPDPLITFPSFSVPLDRRGLEETLTLT